MNAMMTRESDTAQLVESAVVRGDLSKLSSLERTQYFTAVCESVGLNPLTRPFEYIMLNGKLTLYARKDATDQLRKINNVSITIVSREQVGDCYVVTARASAGARSDESIGAVAIGSLKGDALCNALMKAETKAKRRVTLSICGLGILDENELETIPGEALSEPAPLALAPTQTEAPAAPVQHSGPTIPQQRPPAVNSTAFWSRVKELRASLELARVIREKWTQGNQTDWREAICELEASVNGSVAA
jgi:hypothetical protein